MYAYIYIYNIYIYIYIYVLCIATHNRLCHAANTSQCAVRWVIQRPLHDHVGQDGDALGRLRACDAMGFVTGMLVLRSSLVSVGISLYTLRR